MPYVCLPAVQPHQHQNSPSRHSTPPEVFAFVTTHHRRRRPIQPPAVVGTAPTPTPTPARHCPVATINCQRPPGLGRCPTSLRSSKGLGAFTAILRLCLFVFSPARRQPPPVDVFSPRLPSAGAVFSALSPWRVPPQPKSAATSASASRKRPAKRPLFSTAARCRAREVAPAGARLSRNRQHRYGL